MEYRLSEDLGLFHSPRRDSSWAFIRWHISEYTSPISGLPEETWSISSYGLKRLHTQLYIGTLEEAQACSHQ